MPAFRKKPVVIEAVQYHRDQPLPEGCVLAYKDPETGLIYLRKEQAPEGILLEFIVAIQTLEGWHEVSDRDWVITGTAGEKYPCKPERFEEIYEPAD